MSRIHEALRRAAEEQGAIAVAPAETATSPAAESDIVAALAREPFPVEIGTEGRTPAPAGSASVPAFEADDDMPTSDPEAPEPAGRRKTNIFEHLDSRLAEKVVADENMSSVSREQYRKVAGVLLDAQGNNGLRVIMVASALPGEGKTLTATNLALTLSESYRRRVLLIDADLRKPTVHEVFQLESATGLIDGLDGKQKLVVRQVSPNLSVLPAGRPTADPMAALTSERMRRLLDEAKEAFDWVIIDTPPLMLLPDAHLLSSLVDGAILVVKAKSTPHGLVKRTVEVIGRERVLGVVLNQTDAKDQSHYRHYQGDQYLAKTGVENRR